MVHTGPGFTCELSSWKVQNFGRSAVARNACRHAYINVASAVACSPETSNLTELAESVDNTLFQHIMRNPYHVLYHLLPDSANLYITSDQDITIGNYKYYLRSAAQTEFYLPHVVQRLLLTVLLLFLLASVYPYFYLYFNLVQMRSVFPWNEYVCMYVMLFLRQQ